MGGIQIVTAKSAGFCFGVHRAVGTVADAVNRCRSNGEGPLYTYGPIIHNDQVVSEFEQQGVTVINSAQELMNIRKGSVVIRSHGVSKEIYEILNANNVKIIDATCPFVKKIHRIVEKQSAQGRHIVIIGNDSHPEVEGIRGWCNGDVTVIETKAQAYAFYPKAANDICIISQTTFNYNKFKELVEIIKEKRYDILVLNTICNATAERQNEAALIASRVDAMLVIGDDRSSNTQKLFEISKAVCKRTYHVQTAADLQPAWLTDIRSIGITAGASTPHNIIEEVQKNVRFDF